MILAVLAGAVIRYTGVFPDSFTPPGQIQSQVHVEQKNAKSKADSGTIEKHIKESQETGTENETSEAKYRMDMLTKLSQRSSRQSMMRYIGLL